MEFHSHFIAFSAPSGAGKTTIVRRLAEKYPQMVVSVSATTRPPRPTEEDGRDYYFLSKEDFLKAVEENRFLEFEQVHGYYYGTLLETVDALYRQGRVVLFDIDVKGARSVKKHYPEALLIFIKPPDKQELIKRLMNRRSETKETIEKRLQRLDFEYQLAERFDYIVINDELDEALKRIEKLIIKE